MAQTTFETEGGGASWVVLTPSVDDRAWRQEIRRVAEAAGLRVLEAVEGYDVASHEDKNLVIVTNDASVPLIAGVGRARLAAIVPEPGTSYEALENDFGVTMPHSVWQASILLARALALSPLHRVVTADELSRRPASVKLFDDLTLTPPPSAVEVSRRPALNAAFAATYRSAGMRDDEPIDWPNRLFSYDERATRESSDWGVLDITGRPRLLIYGPYLALSPGWWRARIRFGVDRDAASHQYRVDWGTRTACASEYVTPGATGIYEIDLDFHWQETDAAEIRLILTEGSFMGTVLFQGITVSRISDSSARTGQAAAQPVSDRPDY